MRLLSRIDILFIRQLYCICSIPVNDNLLILDVRMLIMDLRMLNLDILMVNLDILMDVR